MDFTRIVRPFERPGTIATKRIVATNEKTDVEPAIFTWGKAGTSVVAEQLPGSPPPLSFGFSVLKDKSLYHEGGVPLPPVAGEDKPTPHESTDASIDTKTVTVRVRNKDDPEEFVDVKRIREVTFAKTKRITDVYPDGHQVDATAKYSIALVENPRSDIWKSAVGDKEQITFRLKPEPNEEIVSGE